ncbi:MAG: choice-of-anchor R domain-containing protein [Patescibacteria group bacterium]|nr:choice-of-anchor R domain-containing protein [Patescibacteria group bacterium]
MNNKGQILAIVVTFLGVSVLLTAVLISFIIGNNYIVQKRYQQKIAFNLAEAGIDKAIEEINQDSSFSGENVDLDLGSFSNNVTSLSGNTMQIESTGYYPSAAQAKTSKTVRAQIELNTDDVAFHYGVQVGAGGIAMANNSEIFGNVYSNGNITGSGIINGTAQVATGSQFSYSHEVQSLGVDGQQVFGQASPVLDLAQSFKVDQEAPIAQVALKLKKRCNNPAQCPPNLTLRILGDDNGSPDKNNVLASGILYASQVSRNDFGWINITLTSNPILSADTTYWLMLDTSANANRYWWWAKDKNQGYGNGLAKYSPNWDDTNPLWTEIIGDLNFQIYLGTNSTYLDGPAVNDDVFAYEIKNSNISGEAYYTFIDSASRVQGSPCPNEYCHPDTPAPPLSNLPISEVNILDWKKEAEAGETIEGDYSLSGTTALGPAVINGNLTIEINAVLELTGTVYVKGDISIINNAQIYLASEYGSLSGLIIADGKIDVQNNVFFCGSGYSTGPTCDTSNNSFIMLLSTSDKATDSDPAIDVMNNAKAVIFYAGQGAIKMHNNAGVYEATAYKLILEQNATVEYDHGLANASFSSGPGASWALKKGTWQVY